jgi:hypothetical protein
LIGLSNTILSAYHHDQAVEPQTSHERLLNEQNGDGANFFKQGKPSLIQ